MFEPRIAAASLSGQSDAAWARAAEPWVGCAFLGGLALDDATRSAARRLRERDRTEFLPDSPARFIHDRLAALSDADLRPAFNVRSADPEAIREAAAVCADHGAILEVNAHCRQAEMCAAGAGESLLRDGERLREQVAVAEAAGATVSAKLRTEVAGVDLPGLCSRLVDAGADILHVDAMDSEPVIADVVEGAPDAFVIANNGVRDRESAVEYLNYGADAVSVGRPSDDPAVLRRVRQAVDEWSDGSGGQAGRSGEVTPDA
ncbi:MAG: TIM-barrel protein [Natronomonas sp.]|jgi:TIM-barrel protein|uniref:tRNA-dihydrouridine synthase n=1 Tax=Natronomonas sp. TaxID=2184060 RepID=UPI00398A348A